MQYNYSTSLALILQEEGGNDDDPQDPGGRTSRGITQREWDAYRKINPDLPRDVWKAPQTAIKSIYKEQYWNPYCDKLPSGIDLCFFNTSVNSGRTQAVRELQRALGVDVDGMLGIMTLQAVSECKDIDGLITRMCDARRKFYRSLKTFPRFGKGWLARTDRVETAAKQMAKANTPKRTDVDGFSQKANVEDKATPIVSAEAASTGTAASSITGAVSDQLQQASTAIEPLSNTFTWIKYACIVIAVICAGLAIYAVIHNRKVNEAV